MLNLLSHGAPYRQVNFFLYCNFPTCKLGQQGLLSCSGCGNLNPAPIHILQTVTNIHLHSAGLGKASLIIKNINHKEEINQFSELFWQTLLMTKSNMELQSTCTSSSFGHLADLPKSEASSLSAPSTAFWEGAMFQIAFHTLPGTNCPLQLPPRCAHGLRWALQVLQLETTIK